MSDQVARTFEGLLTPARRCELYALRNEDKYDIELKVGDGPEDYREIDELSGGAQVSVLVSLVLETDDANPLVIDQPEDELDKAYLFETFLPALRRLKGRRQVIFATHDANIVVNGDAGQVIFLKADHEFGRIAEQGTIEENKVKDAIVNTLDGGREAFTLRQAKYGF
jgi:ABC-type cobalamin/Fe3+-siderophores transport system ATPase subunit